MKKNISINISGIIFHIEEDGYSSLKSYLETINRYFSSYEDSMEIISDIESRIAEIFLTKLSDGKQIITLDDVDGLIRTMGTIADFDAAESVGGLATEEKDEPNDDSQIEPEVEESPNEEEDLGKKKLFRDDRRKVLGGVASGVAYYFSIDPLWIRLLMVVLCFNFFKFEVSVGFVITYIILWLVIPLSKDLGDEESVKKMFRNPEQKVLGGVASGIAAYFGIDITVVRLIFVLFTILGFSGLILYIILWMITPLAKTITEKMQMQGEPVTLSNIQNTVSKSLKTEEGEESALAKILLFPFRVLSELFRVLGNLIGPISGLLLNIIRVAAGILLVFSGILGIISLCIVLVLCFGFDAVSLSHFSTAQIPLEIIPESFSPFLYLSVFLLAVMPLLVWTMLGISALAKRMVISGAIGWSILGIWLIGLLMAVFTMPTAYSYFSHKSKSRESQVYSIDLQEKLYLKLNTMDGKSYSFPELKLRATQDSIVNLVLEKRSFGSDRSNAIENAKMVAYNLVQDGNKFILDSNFEFNEGAKYRGQTLDLILYIPLGQVFVMDNDLTDILTSRFTRSSYSFDDVNSNSEWMFTDQGLQCITCASDRFVPRSDTNRKKNSTKVVAADSSTSVRFEFVDFDQIDLDGVYKLYLSQGEDFDIQVEAIEGMRQEVLIRKKGQILDIGLVNNEWGSLKGVRDDEKIKVYITLPSLEKLRCSGISDVYISNTFNVEKFEIQLEGKCTGKLDVKADHLQVEMSGASDLKLLGKAEEFMANVSGGADLAAYGLSAKETVINTSGLASARIYVNETLTANASGQSTVRYKGHPEKENLNASSRAMIRSHSK